MVKFKLLAQFPVDHLFHPVESSLTLFAQIYWIRYYVIDCFVSVTSESISALWLRLVSSCFDIVLMALLYATIRRDSVSLEIFPFRSHIIIIIIFISNCVLIWCYGSGNQRLNNISLFAFWLIGGVLWHTSFCMLLKTKSCDMICKRIVSR